MYGMKNEIETEPNLKKAKTKTKKEKITSEHKLYFFLNFIFIYSFLRLLVKNARVFSLCFVK